MSIGGYGQRANMDISKIRTILKKKVRKVRDRCPIWEWITDEEGGRRVKTTRHPWKAS